MSRPLSFDEDGLQKPLSQPVSALHSNISLPDLEDVVGPQSSSAHFSVTRPASPLSTHQDRWRSRT